MRLHTTTMQRLVTGSPRNRCWWLTMLALAMLVTLFAGYWLLHCADDTVTPEFCAKTLSSVVLVVLPGLMMIGRLVSEPRLSFVSASLPRFYRPPRLSLA